MKKKIKHIAIYAVDTFYTDNLHYMKKKTYGLFKHVAIITIYPENVSKQSYLGQASGRRLRPQSEGYFRNISEKEKAILLNKTYKMIINEFLNC